jgi:DNA-binding transcriptional regulator YiaG
MTQACLREAEAASLRRRQAYRLRAALDRLHWSGRSLAAILGRDERAVRRWATGAYEPPADALAWLSGLPRFTPHPPAGAGAARFT